MEGYDLEALIFELDQLLQHNRVDTESFLLTYLSQELRELQTSQATVELQTQRIVVDRHVTYGDIAIVFLLVFLTAYTVGSGIYRRIREIF